MITATGGMITTMSGVIIVISGMTTAMSAMVMVTIIALMKKLESGKVSVKIAHLIC